MYTEHPERYNSYQELGRIEHCTSERSQLQQRQRATTVSWAQVAAQAKVMSMLYSIFFFVYRGVVAFVIQNFVFCSSAISNRSYYSTALAHIVTRYLEQSDGWLRE